MNKKTILFWDEPESNLNPKLIRELAKVLVSLFLVKEFEILRETNTKIKYFSLGIDTKDNLRVSQCEDIEVNNYKDVI